MERELSDSESIDRDGAHGASTASISVTRAGADSSTELAVTACDGDAQFEMDIASFAKFLADNNN